MCLYVEHEELRASKRDEHNRNEIDPDCFGDCHLNEYYWWLLGNKSGRFPIGFAAVYICCFALVVFQQLYCIHSFPGMVQTLLKKHPTVLLLWIVELYILVFEHTKLGTYK